MEQRKVGNCLGKTTGITLVALVVTIIVLLILAGVSINLVAGSNGILGKAQKAVDVNNMAQIKEEIELKIAELEMDYYMTDNNFANVNDYVKAELEKGVELPSGAVITTDSSGSLNYDGMQIGTLNPEGSVSIDGEFNGSQIVTKYTVSYNANGGQGGPSSKRYAAGESVTVDFTTKPTKKGANFLGWSRNSTATTPEYTTSGSFSMETQSVTLYAVWEALGVAEILPSNYGDKVNYNANEVSDWRVFYNNGNNIFIITSDYLSSALLPSSTYLEGDGYRAKWLSTNIPNYQSNCENYRSTFLSEKYDLKAISNNTNVKCISTLLNADNWSAFANGVSGSNHISGSLAIGSPTLEMWIESWNAKGYTKLYTSQNDNGYYAGVLPNPSSGNISLEDSTEISDKLYFPYSGEASGATYGYMLASPYGGGTDLGYNWRIGYGGNMYGYIWNYVGYAVRPVVCLKSDIKMNWNGTAWDLSN